MGSISSVTNGVVVGALSSSTVIIEAVIVVVIVALLITILVLSRRKSKQGRAPAEAAPTPQSYYADLQDPAANSQAGAIGGQADPFAGFATAAAGPMAGIPPAPVAPSVPGAPVNPTVPAAPAVAAPLPPPAPAPAPVNLNPPPGTPAGWLPEPNGTPNTLRYWDGSAWTQHVAQRT